MKYYKRWKEHPDRLRKEGEFVGWFEVKEIEAFKKLSGNIREYDGTNSTYDQIKEKLKSGEILHSACAMYIGVPERKQLTREGGYIGHRQKGVRKMYVYIKSEKYLWTVGFYDPAGKWNSESDHETATEAADRVAYLNGNRLDLSHTNRAIREE